VPTTHTAPTHQLARVELWLAAQAAEHAATLNETPSRGAAMDVTTRKATAIVGVADTRSTSLDRLAGEGAGTAAESLRHVLPTDENGRVAVAAFGSSI
jgi:FXSXX-COOH protein